jgi:lactate dehydrogenase-like 2-hydroxyacid dehydrogenase
MNDALITEADVEQLWAAVKTRKLSKILGDFVEAEPHFAEAFGNQLAKLDKAVDAAGMSDEHRAAIMKQLQRTIALNMFLIRNAAMKLIDGLLPSGETEDSQ